jgi:hypothetical protein
MTTATHNDDDYLDYIRALKPSSYHALLLGALWSDNDLPEDEPCILSAAGFLLALHLEACLCLEFGEG